MLRCVFIRQACAIAYDVVITQAGKIFTIDNGSNTLLGGVPILDAAGQPTNQVNNGGDGEMIR